MKACIVCPYDLAEEGGVKRHTMHLAAALRELGDDVDVIGPCRDDRDLGPHTIGFLGVVNVPNNGSDNHIGIFACPYKVWTLFRRRDYDVVHIHEPLIPSLNYWALWSAGRAARVATFHAYSEHESRASRWARRVFSSLAFRSYDRGIAVSRVAERYAAVTFDKPMAVIPNGITTRLYPAESRSASDVLRLLFVGHWRDPRKGLPHLLAACEQLAMPWSLDVVGEGGEHPRSTSPQVRYHGPISSEAELAARYAACDVFVAPSTGMESFGIVLLEAMAAGRAIVCSDIEGYRDVVGTGPGALRVEPGSPAALAAAITELAIDPAKRMRFEAVNVERAREFEWSRLAVRIRDEYLAAIESRHGAGAAVTHAVRSPMLQVHAGLPHAGP